MSGPTSDGDVAALMDANSQELGSPTQGYEVTDGGFSNPEAGPERTGAQEPIPATPNSESKATEDTGEVFLGAPREATEEGSSDDDVTDDDDSVAESSYDDIIAGLTTAAQSERKARQDIQAALKEREEALTEARAFRERYEPHIDELSELWPQIQQQSLALEEAKRLNLGTQKRLELYRAAAQEAGLDVGESALDQADALSDIRRQYESLPNIIDQRVARVIDQRSDGYAQSESRRLAAEASAKAAVDREVAVATKLDAFYEKNPGMKEFDTFIRREVAADPAMDPAIVAAPFLKVISRDKAVRKGKTKGAVKVAGSDSARQTSSASESGERSLEQEYANMSIDQQVAKMRRSGLLR